MKRGQFRICSHSLVDSCETKGIADRKKSNDLFSDYTDKYIWYYCVKFAHFTSNLYKQIHMLCY